MYSAKIINPVQRGFYADVGSRPISPNSPWRRPWEELVRYLPPLSREEIAKRAKSSLEHFPRYPHTQEQK